jgi:hypothetical protein
MTGGGQTNSKPTHAVADQTSDAILMDLRCRFNCCVGINKKVSRRSIGSCRSTITASSLANGDPRMLAYALPPRVARCVADNFRCVTQVTLWQSTSSSVPTCQLVNVCLFVCSHVTIAKLFDSSDIPVRCGCTVRRVVSKSSKFQLIGYSQRKRGFRMFPKTGSSECF